MIAEAPDGFEIEHRGSAYRIDRDNSPSLRGGGLSPSRDSAKDAGTHCRQSPAALRSRLVHVRDYSPPSWLTKPGAFKKRKAIERKGLPSLKNWRFITLTLDQDLFEDSPLAGYLHAKDHMRRFLFACRKAGLWADEAKWAWKMEFQSNGWPHWHLLVGRTRKFSEDEMATIRRLWGLGRTQVERVRVDQFLYSFKYAFKQAFQVDDEESATGAAMAPAWFLDFLGRKTVTVRWTDEDGVQQSERVEKPASFSRVRFWQTSKGFYTGPTVEAAERKPQVTWQVPCPVRVQADRLSTTVQVVARDSGGTYVASGVVTLSCVCGEFWNSVAWQAIHGAAVGLSVNSYAIPAFVLTYRVANKWKLQQLLQQNRLSHRAAARLQRDRQTLRTC